MASMQHLMDLVDGIAEDLKAGRTLHYIVYVSQRKHSVREIYLAIRLGVWADKLKLELV